MTPQEAVAACDFWTLTVAETQALGSSTNVEIAGVFGCNVSTPRCYWSDPTGPRNWDIRVRRWLSSRQEDGSMLTVENPLYTLVVEEIARRQAAGLRG